MERVKFRVFMGPPRDFKGGGSVGVFGGCKKRSRTNPTKKLGKGIWVRFRGPGTGGFWNPQEN